MCDGRRSLSLANDIIIPNSNLLLECHVVALMSIKKIACRDLNTNHALVHIEFLKIRGRLLFWKTPYSEKTLDMTQCGI